MTIYERVQRIRKAVKKETQLGSTAINQAGERQNKLDEPARIAQIAAWKNGWSNFSNWSGNFNKGP